MGWDAPWHWVVVAVLVIALFGYKKMPDAARAMGRSLRIFKTEIKGMSEDDKAREAARDADKQTHETAALEPPKIDTVTTPPPVDKPTVTTPPNGADPTKE